MAFDGTEGEQISLQEAAALTANYRAQNPDAIKGHFMGKDIINSILAQTGCMGIRTYHGINNDGTKEIVLVGVDANGDDMTNLIADRCRPCPNMCSRKNSLNS